MGMLEFPHVRYISFPDGKSIKMYYLGGESEENDCRLTIGKKYRVYQARYAKHRGDKRVTVWVSNDDEDKGKLCQIDKRNFSPYPLNKRRDDKLNKILK